ncbi:MULTISPECIES: 16S rRNA (guanine(966)-N(2))-methyltransferase RsmD [Alphaproteobacteria]|jgi:16S rRNA (guanine966-N2)-methyltransferase|uniref:RsmD family RNA methyltransferase n=3 Tax=Sphingobium yanoikuyae TaxID=13690 RepID=K9D1D2_SPHYA|nr:MULTISPECIES: 16S rRNA (guanine(966)-N(2))-methyltransferase RsmD [Alphaproteobacteria]EKU76946.1 RsmD family RNA methyltransferase [Sphingobium yanoikuyae ATCC 51230]KFD28971.1 methyltransferase [Sphingobium yanoikuyae]KZC75326.1 16S rRNA (guanine(966)-N(2))-methyltransferase RsmD [Sphingobium yanoikuyae]MBT2245417.1 16S rRNA (guanine(966)-N(2))-methyltransferase RsmD [Sphingobium sp. BHU LFT2]MDG2511934.1 16S rRNA (guanine(966)-N(2))-methyltransferase RsmD [Sphingobium yanoikuyae]
MRIISGQWRGRPLVAPKGDATRPTGDRTRETLFSMLASRLGSFEGLAVGDFFAGSGALGFEALSRGAGSCLFVEQDKAAIDAIRANGDKLGLRPDIRQTSVLSLGPTKTPLDLIFMDPPYDTGAGQVALDKLARLGWTSPATWISIETDRREDVAVKGFIVDAVRDVGKARLTLLRAEDSAPAA